MNLNLLKKSKRFRQDAGIALLTTILLLFLMSSLLVGFAVLLLSNQQLAGANNDQVTAFYAAEAGMEKMTSDLGNLFSQTYSPSIGQVNALETSPPPLTGITYVTKDGNPGYTITPAAVDKYNNPAPTITTIKSGPYQGMTAMATEYTLMVNARTSLGREVNLLRTTQTVGIPMFQFGIFADTDLDFFPGPTFSFGGRTHTNGNLWLAGQSTLTLSDKVDAYKDVLRTRLENGYATAGTYTGTVNIATQPCTQPCTPNVRALAMNEGSLTGTVAPYDTPTYNKTWQSISQTSYNSNLRNGQGSAFPQNSTGASQLNLGLVTIGKGSTQPVDLVRRPAPGESAGITNERYFAQSSLRVLLSDNKTDITGLSCVSAGDPFDLSYMASDPGINGANWLASTYAPLVALTKKMIANGVVPLPLAASGAASTAAYTATDGYWLPTSAPNYPNAGTFPTVKGFIKIDLQTAPYPTACTSTNETDVTIEVLALGYVGRNINPITQSLDGTTMNPGWQYTAGGNMQTGVAPEIPNLLTNILGYQNTATVIPSGTFSSASLSTTASPRTCLDPHPYAVIRLERIRDNPSSAYYNTGKLSTTKPTNYPYQSTVGEACGVDPASPTQLAVTRSGVSTGGVKGTASTWRPQPYDFWPNTLFDPREGELREAAMSTAAQPLPTLNGTMHYIELDAKNLASWFGGKVGTIATSGQSTLDTVVAPNNFLFYISDRRGNYDNGLTFTASKWPPVSPSGNETGEYGWTDLVNASTDPTNGCPNNALETGEDVDGVSTLFTYGANASYIHGAGLGLTAGTLLGPGQLGVFTTLAGTGVTSVSDVCTAVPAYSTTDKIWPMMLAANTNAARENPPLFFRRAVKIVNGSDLTGVGTCPSTNVTCGLAIASENPVYVQGDYNANIKGAGWGSTEVPSSVAGDAVTLLSVQWNDLNSFISPYKDAGRQGTDTWYRAAIIGGGTVPFTQPNYKNVPADFGTDGGVHNFLRYVETWGGTLHYQGSIVDLFTSRQANGTFKCCGTVYGPPTRGYIFDSSFLNPSLLPPRTPLFRDVNTTGWTRVLQPLASSYK